MKKILLTASILVIVISSLFYIVIDNSFNKPYNLVEELFTNEKKLNNINISVLTEKQWKEISETSPFVKVREPVDIERITSCPNLLFEEGNAPLIYKIKEFQSKQINITVRCLNNDQSLSFQSLILLEKVEGEWKIVGEVK